MINFSCLTGVMIKNTAKMYLVPDSKISPLLNIIMVKFVTLKGLVVKVHTREISNCL